MNVTSKLKMDMTRPDLFLSTNAVQGDTYSRTLQIALYTGMQPWIIPEGVIAAIRYAKPDHTKGYYDTMPDGTKAWSIQENVLTIRLAPQMLTAAGIVKAQVELIQETHILSTFSLTICVEANPAAGVLTSEDYTNWVEWLRDQSKKQVDAILQTVQSADDAALRAREAAQETASMAAKFTAIVAGNQAYTKRESDLQYSPAVYQTASGKSIHLPDSSRSFLRGLHLFGKTTQNGVPTPEAPVPLQSIGDDGSVDVTICGKNLFTEGIIYGGGLNQSYGQLQLTVPLTSPATRDAWGGVGIRVAVIPSTAYTVSSDISPSDYFTVTFYRNMEDVNKYTNAISHIERTSTNRVSFTTPADCYCVVITAVSKAAASFTWSWWLCEPGSTATEYGPQEDTQILTLLTPRGLAGIPVSSGGNYTDQNGQQWLCDEADFEKGLCVQRIGRIDNYAGEEISGIYLSTTGALTEGAVVLYPLAQEISMVLTSEEMEAYSAAYTNYPNTTIFNSDGAEMAVSYLTDLKLYIDNLVKGLSA